MGVNDSTSAIWFFDSAPLAITSLSAFVIDGHPATSVDEIGDTYVVLGYGTSVDEGDVYETPGGPVMTFVGGGTLAPASGNVDP